MHREAEAEAASEAEEAQGVASVVRREDLVASAVEGEVHLGAVEEATEVILPGFGVLRRTWFMVLRTNSYVLPGLGYCMATNSLLRCSIDVKGRSYAARDDLAIHGAIGCYPE